MRALNVCMKFASNRSHIYQLSDISIPRAMMLAWLENYYIFDSFTFRAVYTYENKYSKTQIKLSKVLMVHYIARE